MQEAGDDSAYRAKCVGAEAGLGVHCPTQPEVRHLHIIAKWHQQNSCCKQQVPCRCCRCRGCCCIGPLREQLHPQDPRQDCAYQAAGTVPQRGHTMPAQHCRQAHCSAEAGRPHGSCFTSGKSTCTAQLADCQAVQSYHLYSEAAGVCLLFGQQHIVACQVPCDAHAQLLHALCMTMRRL